MRMALQRTNGNIPTASATNRTNQTSRQHDGMGMDKGTLRTMKIHGFHQNLTCEDFLPKKKWSRLGYVALCTQCRTLYVLEANFSATNWKPVKGKK
jgi:hypothetical protein